MNQFRLSICWIIFIILISSLVYAEFSTDRTKYYFGGTYYLTDNLESADIALNGSSAIEGQSLCGYGWVLPTPDPCNLEYDDARASLGSLSIKTTGGVFSYFDVNNATFSGRVGGKFYCVSPTNSYAIPKVIDGSSVSMVLGFFNNFNADYYFYGSPNTLCDKNTIPRIWDAWVPWEYVWKDGYVLGYINDVLCHNWSSVAGLNRILPFQEGQGVSYWSDEFWVSNGARPELASLPPTLSDPICTSCVAGTNKTPDITPTINITCTSVDDCQGVRIANNSAYDYMNATSDRNCSRGDLDTWVCTLPASDQISAEGQTSLYFWANSSVGNYHLAWNETIALTYNLGFNTSFGAGISKIKWIVPFYTGTTAYNVSPVNETDSVSLWIVGNNGTATGQVSMRLNASYPSVVTECARDSLYNDELILNESWQIINSSLLYGERCPIWCRRNYTAIPVKQVINWQFNFTSI